MSKALTLIMCTVIAIRAQAQTGTFGGTIARDSAGTPVAKAQVDLPQLNRTATTNILGNFEFTEVPAGRYAVTVRAIGFQPFLDSIDIKAGARIDGDIMLTSTAVALEAVRTTAPTVEKRLPAGLSDMEERRKTHLGGVFVTDSALRAHDERKLTFFLASVPGIHQVLQGGETYLSNGRERGDGGPAFMPRSSGSSAACFISVYVNGTKLFVGPPSVGNDPPNFDALWAREYSGIEYYPSGATMPSEYNGTGSSCGLLLLWTRR